MYETVPKKIDEFPESKFMIPEESKNKKVDKKKGFFANFFGNTFKNDKNEKKDSKIDIVHNFVKDANEGMLLPSGISMLKEPEMKKSRTEISQSSPKFDKVKPPKATLKEKEMMLFLNPYHIKYLQQMMTYKRRSFLHSKYQKFEAGKPDKVSMTLLHICQNT